MKTITVAELRQNPTAALAEVEAGETYVVTRHRRAVARLVPNDLPADEAGEDRLIPARNPHPTNFGSRRPWTLTSAASVDELLHDLKGDR